jgi:hypothetical protein
MQDGLPINIIRKWAERKDNRATDWLMALWDIACQSRCRDQHPPQVVDLVVERTGGRPITVALPNLVDGEVTIDHDRQHVSGR